MEAAGRAERDERVLESSWCLSEGLEGGTAGGVDAKSGTKNPIRMLFSIIFESAGH